MFSFIKIKKHKLFLKELCFSQILINSNINIFGMESKNNNNKMDIESNILSNNFNNNQKGLFNNVDQSILNYDVFLKKLETIKKSPINNNDAILNDSNDDELNKGFIEYSEDENDNNNNIELNENSIIFNKDVNKDINEEELISFGKFNNDKDADNDSNKAVCPDNSFLDDGFSGKVQTLFGKKREREKKKKKKKKNVDGSEIKKFFNCNLNNLLKNSLKEYVSDLNEYFRLEKNDLNIKILNVKVPDISDFSNELVFNKTMKEILCSENDNIEIFNNFKDIKINSDIDYLCYDFEKLNLDENIKKNSKNEIVNMLYKPLIDFFVNSYINKISSLKLNINDFYENWKDIFNNIRYLTEENIKKYLTEKEESIKNINKIDTFNEKENEKKEFVKNSKNKKAKANKFFKKSKLNKKFGKYEDIFSYLNSVD